ncbi:ATP-binding cassette transporter snq2, partial [Coemansia guatemalensis]
MGNKRQLIHGVSGEVKEGEMLLVLGRPGSGCSTLLRVLGNHRKTYTKIDGTVSYGGLSPKEVLRHYRGEVAYNQEDDMHFPTLTVRKTLDFAIKCRTPSRQVLRDSGAYQRDVLQMLYDMYGLGGCADTIVGNAFLRGVSGGERKRVSIAEQVAIGASVEVWDNSTRGLDASSALDYVHSLRINADTLKKAEVATICQASESIYRLFDKVMVLDEGRQLYFGPTTEAVAYFERLGMYKPPRQTTSDFLTGLTKLNERRVRSGWENRVPTTAVEFEQKWRESPEYHEMRKDVEAFGSRISQDGRGQELRELIDRTKMGTEKLRMRRRSPYTTTFILQFYMLLVREWEIFVGAPAMIIFRVIYNIAFAIIVGTLFIQLPQNTSSFFIRGGLLFFSLLFNTFTSMSEVPKAVSGRLVIYKHKALAMYHPAALSLAQTVVDITFMIFQVLVFGAILYWATSLQPYGGQFLAFLLFLYIGSICMISFFRLIGNISPNIDIGHTLSGVSLLFLILYVGYLIPPPLMHHYLKWIYWINPLAYGVKAMLSNEYRNIRYPCDPRSLVPQGPGISIANQVCISIGANPGMATVKGSDYLERGFSIHVVNQWKDFLAVTSFWILFVILNAVVIEFVEFGNTGYPVNVCKRFRPNVDSLIEDPAAQGKENEEEEVRKRIYADIPPGGPTDEQIAQGTTYTWNQVNYTVPVKGGERQLLNNISGYIKPGTMTALMGSSGAGKTTLLDALSQRKTIGKLEGEMLMNGAEQPPSFRRITGYCEQLDVHNPHATVREALRFSAALRCSPSVSARERDSYVEYVILLLGLRDISDCMIGDPESKEGISLEERKRLTIGVELVVKPKILFLDEPTSGLDAQASYSIVRFISKLAAE